MEENNNQEINDNIGVEETSENSNQNEKQEQTKSVPVSSNPNRNLILGVVITLLILAGGYFYMQNSSKSVLPLGLSETTSSSSFEVDSKVVVAKVNGTELFGDRLNMQMKQTAQLSGIPSLEGLDEKILTQIKSQSIDAIINTELILQTARETGLSVSDDIVEKELKKITDNIGGEDIVKQRLEALGFTEETFKVNLANDILITDYLATIAEASELAVSEEEIKSFYDQVSSQQDNVPALENVRSQIEQQIGLQKKQAILSSVVEKMRVDAEIEILI